MGVREDEHVRAWEETWAADTGWGPTVVFSDVEDPSGPARPHGAGKRVHVGSFDSAERAKLAAKAPEFARVALSMARTLRGMGDEGHKDFEALAEMMREAGMEEALEEMELEQAS